jgi:uncharacterized RDD family membrane protein YckC
MEAYRPAGLWPRIRAFALDYLPIAAYLILLVGAGVVARRVWQPVTDVLFGSPLSGEATGFLLVTLPIGLYFALSEASSRRATWGKLRIGLRVTDVAGQRIGYGRSISRTVLKFIPWEIAHACIWQISFASDKSSPAYVFGFAAVWLLVAVNVVSLLLSRRRQALYDRIAGTLVLRDLAVADRTSASSRRAQVRDRLNRVGASAHAPNTLDRAKGTETCL